MSIHRTKNNTYRVRWRFNGRMKSKTFRRKVDAQKFDALKKSGSAVEVNDQEKARSTLADMSKIWLHDYGEVHKTKGSLIRDKQILKDYILPALGDKYLDEIEKYDIIQLQASLKTGNRLSPKSINNIMGLLKKILKDALSWGYCEKNVGAGIKPLKCPEQDFAFWTFAERDRFLTYYKSRDREMYDLVAFGGNTGLRRGEIEGLYRDALDFDRRMILVKRSFDHKTGELQQYTKGKTIRSVPMNDVVYDMLKDKKLLPPNAQIFAGIDFEHFLIRVFRPAQIEAGVSAITIHGLRHTFASLLAMSGVSIFVIQKLLGHQDIKTTMRYAHLAPDHLKGQTDVLVTGKVLTDSNIDEKGNSPAHVCNH